MVPFATLMFAGSLALHPMHIAFTNIEISAQADSITVAHKVFTTDFSLLFFHLFEKTIEPRADTEFNTSEINLINHYMKYRFILVSGTDTIRLNYLNKKQEDESLWLYYSGRLPNTASKSLEINDLLLFDLYMDQTNLVIVTSGAGQKGYSFNWDNRQSILELKE